MKKKISDAEFLKRAICYGIYNTPSAIETFRKFNRAQPLFSEDIIDECYQKTQQQGFTVPSAKKFLGPRTRHETGMVSVIIRNGIHFDPSAVEAFRPISNAYPNMSKDWVDECYLETQHEGFEAGISYVTPSDINKMKREAASTAGIRFRKLEIHVNLNAIIITKISIDGRKIRSMIPLSKKDNPKEDIEKAIGKIVDVLRTPNVQFTRLAIHLSVNDNERGPTDVVWMFSDALKNIIHGLDDKLHVEQFEVPPKYLEEMIGFVDQEVLSSLKIREFPKNRSKVVDYYIIKDIIQLGKLEHFEMMNCELNVSISELASIEYVSAASNVYADEKAIKDYFELLKLRKGPRLHKWNVYHPEIDLNTFFDDYTTLQCDPTDQKKRCWPFSEHLHLTVEFSRNKIYVSQHVHQR